ncbi:uncharacterized protein LOC106077742 [Biomphalaria glabrata]|uniref:Uncharacterized protein LOC106077742 n=1 Tax=Biomphalaria glabrata TaxID=6526 RepID=A0A9W2YMB9_BIOGL|nr:uncharacterized protein LOC106077742 [Biomphalaria glabrata]KAI8795134.1 F-box only protein 42 [Biomphalaria glabrata]
MEQADLEDVGEPLKMPLQEPHCATPTAFHEGVHIHKTYTLNDMPEEILEHILGFLSPYCDMDAARLVSKQWHRVIQSVVIQRKRRFYQKLMCGEINWAMVSKDNICNKRQERSYVSCISERHSHSAVYFEGSMYIFGGCTSTNTTFNDLWKFDLTTRQWIRPVAMGTYPSPKACATMVVYRGNLVLFGGWSHPIPYPNPHQSAHYFSELHVYSPATNRWSHILSIGQEPEPLGGHSASVAGHLMVIFGGSPRTGLGTNNIWVFNFQKLTWKLQPVLGDVKPEPRYGQYQTTMDDSHILIMGGSGGQNRVVYNDVWLLTLHSTEPWFWTKITVDHPELAAPHSWCHAACRVNQVIVVVAKANKLRQTRNIRRKVGTSPQLLSEGCSTSLGAQVVDQQVAPQDRLKCQDDCADHVQHSHQDSVNSLSQGVSSQGTSSNEEEKRNNFPNKNLLELQQKLHRECANLSDPSDHHHSAYCCDEPEGSFHRLNSRWGNNSQGQASHQHQQLTDQPQQGSFHRGNPRLRGTGHMPSIRPNATCNRQKQLEALQRQEEILRNKSRALAAARNKLPGASASSSLELDETLPDIITSKNKMDVHVLDLSRLMSEQTVEWKPLSSLQPVGAPTETVCFSLLEGRSELLLFGGVARDMKHPPSSNTAINKLYILHAN